MLKIFRKLREQVLIENKISKYLLYALGEITLVVIGILIALQVDSSKETKKNAKVEEDYLKGIVTELDLDIYDLKELEQRYSYQEQSYSMLLKAFDNVPMRNTTMFIRAVGMANTCYTFEGNDNVFEDMKSSGRINYIQSDQLRLKILKYYKEANASRKAQRESTVPQMRGLSERAFLTNLDMNSFIEGYMFDSTDGVEVDPLEFSFFDKDKNSDEVKSFANHVSMMKAIVEFVSDNNDKLLFNAEKLKDAILTYLDGKGVKIENRVPVAIIDAIKSGNVETLEALVNSETLNDCFFMDEESGNYLVHCITYESLPSLKFFVEKGADLELVCERKTPLMYAVKYGELDMVKYLVEQGASLEASNHGKTPLSYSRNYEHPEIEDYLMSVGAK